MRHLPTPTDKDAQPFIPRNVFEICVSMVRNQVLKNKLLSICSKVEIEAIDYDTKAAVKQLYLKTPHNHVGLVSHNEMVKVYSYRMAPKAAKGRPIYNQIMLAPVNGICPLCGIGSVNTLDHYLPKQKFPVYSVTPNNLIPACAWCQKEKGEYYTNQIDRQILHPYFDKIDNELWLSAKLVHGKPAAFRYFASPPNHWTQIKKNRVKIHLNKLKLPKLFSSNAGSRLSEIRTRLRDLYRKGGNQAVREYLQEELDSIEADHMNSWSAAMYRAAVADNWFCGGGFSGT